MQWLLDYYRSAVGRKMAMAITGVLLFLYVFAHMLGNLQIFIPIPPGQEPAINVYAWFLHSHPVLLWVARVVMGSALLVHVLAATQLTLGTWKARPVGYAKRKYRAADLAARTMVWSGPVIGLFLIYHILHLTVGVVGPEKALAVTNAFARENGVVSLDCYHNVVAGFKVWWISAIYGVAIFLLFLHFWHGLWSWFQTLGWSHPAHDTARRWFGRGLALLILIGDLSIPIAVLLGGIKEGV
jgi:succinate dehydrogenase / fumarate reductase cytochrome b subunit